MNNIKLYQIKTKSSIIRMHPSQGVVILIVDNKHKVSTQYLTLDKLRVGDYIEYPFKSNSFIEIFEITQIIDEHDSFWTVIDRGKMSVPTKYLEKENAIQEAKRLSNIKKNTYFYVGKMICGIITKHETEVIELESTNNQ